MTTEVLRLGMHTAGFEAGGKRVQTTLGRITAQGFTTQKMLGALGVTLGAAVLVSALGSATRGFIEFDQAMTSSLAIMRDVNSQMRDEMVKSAREVAEAVNFASKDVAESYYFLASAGLDAAQSVAALPAVARFARAGMFDLAKATDLATDAQSALGLASKDAQVNLVNMTRVTDVLVKANTLANASVEQFSMALTREAGAALKSFRIDVEEGVAVLAAFADQGVKAEVAGTGLSRILRLMTAAAVDNKEAYEKYNVSVFDAQGRIRNLADIIGDLERAFADMSDETRVAALQQLGFQARVQGVIMPLLGTSEKIREYETALREAGGTTKEVSDNQMQSLENRIGQIKIAFQNWRDEIVEKTVPAIELFIENVHALAAALKLLLGVAVGRGMVALYTSLAASSAASAQAAKAAEVERVANIRAAQSALQKAEAAHASAVATVAAAQAEVEAAVAAQRYQVVMKGLAVTHEQTTAAVAREANAVRVLAAAQAQATATSDALIVAQNGLTAAATASGVAAGRAAVIFRGFWTLIGGWVGVAIAAVWALVTAIGHFRRKAAEARKEAREAAEEEARELAERKAGLAALTDQQLKLARAQLATSKAAAGRVYRTMGQEDPEAWREAGRRLEEIRALEEEINRLEKERADAARENAGAGESVVATLQEMIDKTTEWVDAYDLGLTGMYETHDALTELRDELRQIAEDDSRAMTERIAAAQRLKELEEEILEVLRDQQFVAFRSMGFPTGGREEQGRGGMVDSVREWLGLPGIPVEVRNTGQEAADAFLEPWEEALREIHRTFSQTFDDMLHGQLDSFESFADRVLDVFVRLASEIAAVMTSQALGIDKLLAAIKEKGRAGLDVNALGKAVKYGGGAVVGAGIGYQTGSPVGGALSGAAAGLALGGPPGAILGAVSGLVGGLFGAAKKAKEAKKAFQNALDSWQDSFDQLKRMFVDESSLEAALNDLSAKVEQAFDDLKQVFKKGSKFEDLPSVSQIEQQIAIAQAKGTKKLQRFWEQALELAKEAEAAAGRAAEREQERIDAIQRGLDVDQLRLEGKEAEARAIEREIELLRAQEQGYTDAQIAQLKHIQALREEERQLKARADFDVAMATARAAGSPEDVEAQRLIGEIDIEKTISGFREFVAAGTITEAELASLEAILRDNLNVALEETAQRAAAAAEAIERTKQSFEADLQAREAGLAGRDQTAYEISLRAQAQQEIDRAEDLLTAGTITEEMFRRLVDVLEGEVAQALEQFDEDLKEAARSAREAAAAERYRAMTDTENLRIRLLTAQGRDEEAQILRQQLEIIAAVNEGRSGEYIAMLQQIHATERAKAAADAQTAAVEGATRAAEAMSEAFNSPQGVRLSLLRYRASILSEPPEQRTTQTTAAQVRVVQAGTGTAGAVVGGGGKAAEVSPIFDVVEPDPLDVLPILNLIEPDSLDVLPVLQLIEPDPLLVKPRLILVEPDPVVIPTRIYEEPADRNRPEPQKQMQYVERQPVEINVSVASEGKSETDEQLARRLARLIQIQLRAGAPHLFNDIVT